MQTHMWFERMCSEEPPASVSPVLPVPLHVCSVFPHLGLSNLRLVPLLGLLQLRCLILAQLCCRQLTAGLLLAAISAAAIAACSRPAAAATAWPVHIFIVVISAAGGVPQRSDVIMRLCCVEGVKLLQLLADRTAAMSPAIPEQQRNSQQGASHLELSHPAGLVFESHPCTRKAPPVLTRQQRAVLQVHCPSTMLRRHLAHSLQTGPPQPKPHWLDQHSFGGVDRHAAGGVEDGLVRQGMRAHVGICALLCCGDAHLALVVLFNLRDAVFKTVC